MTDVADRITAITPAPSPSTIAATAVIALIVAWPWSRWLNLVNIIGTLAHEFGHAALAVLTGGGVRHIALTSSKSGHTRHVSKGSLARSLTALAGYCFPPLLGLGAAGLLAEGRAAWVLTGEFALCVLVLLVARGLLTVTTVVGLGALLAVLVLFADAWPLTAAAYLLAWLLIATGIEGPLMDVLIPRLLSYKRHQDDADTLASVTRVPAPIWGLAWLALAGWCAWQAATLLWP